MHRQIAKDWHPAAHRFEKFVKSVFDSSYKAIWCVQPLLIKLKFHETFFSVSKKTNSLVRRAVLCYKKDPSRYTKYCLTAKIFETNHANEQSKLNIINQRE